MPYLFVTPCIFENKKRIKTTYAVENVVITTKGVQDRNIHMLDGTTVENKGILILTFSIFPDMSHSLTCHPSKIKSCRMLSLMLPFIIHHYPLCAASLSLTIFLSIIIYDAFIKCLVGLCELCELFIFA